MKIISIQAHRRESPVFIAVDGNVTLAGIIAAAIPYMGEDVQDGVGMGSYTGTRFKEALQAAGLTLVNVESYVFSDYAPAKEVGTCGPNVLGNTQTRAGLQAVVDHLTMRRM